MTSSARAIRGLEVALFLVLFAPLLWEWAQTAGASSRLSYALLVPALSTVLVARAARGRTGEARSAPGSAPLASALALAAALVLGLGTLTGVFTLSLLAFPVAVAAWVARRRGKPGLRAFGPGLCLLLAMVPPPMPVMDRVNPFLIEASGRAAEWILMPLDPGVSWLGSTLSFRGWTLIVAEACSGSGTFLALFVLCLFLAGLFRMRLGPGLLLVVLSAPVAWIGNGVRIALSAVLIDRFGPGAGSGTPHELLGQLVVITSAVALAWLVDRLSARGRLQPC